MALTELDDIRIGLRCDTTDNWAISDLVLLRGEPAIELTKDGFPKMKIGDGVNIFKNLKYANFTDVEIKTFISQLAVNSISLVTGASNGQIGITVDGQTTYADVKGLGSAAYTNSTNYATAAQGTKADNAMPKSGGTFTGFVTLSADPTDAKHAATKNYVDTKISSGIAAADAMIFKGTLGTGGTVTALPTTYKTGWTYRVVTAGTYAGQVCEPGDLIIALTNRSGSGTTNADWTVCQTNIDGAITAAGAGLKKSGTTIAHSNSVTAGTAQGGSGAVAWGGSVTLPKITYDSTGHITGVTTTTITFPANPNTDTKVTNTLNNTKKFYLTGTETATTNTGGQTFNSNVYVSESGNDLHAGKFTGPLTGNVTGNATSATKLANLRNFSISGGATAANVGFTGEAAVELKVSALNTDFLRNGANVLILDGGGA